MTTSPQSHQLASLTLGTVISYIFGMIVLAIGVINTFWGNDTAFGIFAILLSLVYFLPFDSLVKRFTGITLPWPTLIRTILGVLLLIGALGVGELFDKIELMQQDLL